jgi:predicted SpoU family rRNA methylase
MVRVIIHVPLLCRITGSSEVISEGQTLQEIIDKIDDVHPGFKAQVLSRQNGLNNYLQVYAKQKGVKELRLINDIDKEITDVEEIKILPIACGG